MHSTRRLLSKIPIQSFLIGILHLIGLLSLYRDDDKKRGHPYVYPTSVMLRCRVVMIWLRIPSNNCLHQYFEIDMPYNRRVMRACGLHALPDRRTFDRRFKILPIGIIISTMGRRFGAEGLADVAVASVDSTLVTAKGPMWHWNHIRKGIIPRSGIDTDARWGFAKTKGWVFGYKIHMISSTGDLVVPLAAEVTPANIHDHLRYCELVECLPDSVRYIAGDLGYRDYKLHDYSRQRGIVLVCPIRRFRHTKKNRLEMIRFYRSRKGQGIYGTRRVSIEPLFDCVKETFGISVAPVRGLENVSSYLLSCVFVYQIAVYYNCVRGSKHPRCVRYMLGN